MSDTNVGNAVYKVTADASGVTKGLTTAEGQIKRSGAAAERAFGQQATAATGKFGGSLGRLQAQLSSSPISRGVLQGVGMGAGLVAFQAVGMAVSTFTNFMGDSIQAASDLNETLNKSEVVFGSASDEIKRFGESAATAMGLSENAAIGAAATFGNLFKSLGTAPDKIAPMSEALVKLASDLASFNNIPIEDALAKLQSGIVGQERPLRELGVAISAASVDVEAARLGFQKLNGTFSEGEKVQARYSLIFQQTGTAQGDFARTADGLANTQRILNAELQDATAAIGTALLPVVKDLVVGFKDLVSGGVHASLAIREVTDAVAAQALVAPPKQPFQDQLNSMADGWAALNKVIRPGIDEENQWIAANKSLGDSIGATNADMMLFFGTLKYSGGKTVPEITQALQDLVAQQIATKNAATLVATNARKDADLWDTSWTGATTDVSAAFVDVKYHVLRDVGQMTQGIEATIKDAKSGVLDAAKGLEWAIEHPMAAAHEKSRLQALLTSKDLVKGLNSKNDEIRAAAEFYRSTIMDKLNALAPAVHQKGIDVATAFINGVEVTLPSNIFGLFNLGPGGFGGGTGRGGHYGRHHGPGRARGGPVGGMFGSVFRVGENGPETLVMGGGLSGVIRPNISGALQSASSTMHHDGTVRLELSASSIAAMHQAGYSGREVGEAARAASGVDGLLRNLDRAGNLPLEPSF